MSLPIVAISVGASLGASLRWVLGTQLNGVVAQLLAGRVMWAPTAIFVRVLGSVGMAVLGICSMALLRISRLAST